MRRRILIAVVSALLAGAPFALAQYIPGSGGGGGGGGSNNCTNNSSPSDVLFNNGGNCAGNAGFTYDGVNHVTANDTGAPVPSGPAPVVRYMAQGANALSPVVDGGPSIGVTGFTSGSFGGEPAFSIYAASGTPSSPAANTDALLGSSLLAYAYDGSAWAQGARIDIWNDSVAGWTPTDHGTGICLGTTGHGNTNAKNDALCVDDDRGIIAGGNAFAPASLNGYGTINNAGLWHKNIAFRMDGIVNTDISAVTEKYPNSATGTNAGKIAKLVNGTVQTVTTADTLDGIGICVAGVTNTGCTTTGNASIAYAGQVPCFADGSVTAGHWVIVSTTVAGDCSDGGAPVPTGVEVLGTWVSTNVGAGLYTVDLNPMGIAAVVIAHGGGGGGGAPTTCNSTAESNNYACRNIAASWSAGQRSTPKVVTLSTSTFTQNMDDSDNFEFDLVHASCPCQIANPTNLTAGQTGVMFIVQSSTGGDTVTWGGNFAFPNGTPTLQTTASAKDYFSFYVESSSRIVIVPASGAYGAVQQVVNYNTAAPPTFPTDTGFAVNGANSTDAGLAASSFAATARFRSLRADGTGASPTAVQSGEEIGGLSAWGYNGSAYLGPQGLMRFYAAENFAVGHGGTKGCIATTPVASTTVADQLCVASNGTVTLGGVPITPQSPQGRLTLVTGVPVMTSDQTAKSTVYYDCYNGKLVPYYDGTGDLLDSIASCEVSLTMQTSGTGVTNSGGVFDIWWVHSGASRICVATNGSGSGWASDTGGSNTARGTGYSQVHNTRGYWTNVNAIAHCYNGTTDYGSVSADQATYLGTLTTTAAGQTGVQFNPSPANGGANNVVGLWNAYNRVRITSTNYDNAGGNGNSWTYNSATWRTKDGSNSNRVTQVDGLGLTTVVASWLQYLGPGGTSTANIGVVQDSTTATPTFASQAFNTITVMSNGAQAFQPAIGLHYEQMMESRQEGTNAATFFGMRDGSQASAEICELDM